MLFFFMAATVILCSKCPTPHAASVLRRATKNNIFTTILLTTYYVRRWSAQLWLKQKEGEKIT